MSKGLGPDFNRIWSAGLITNLADGVLRLAAPLLAITLTRDPVLISLLSALSLLPWLFFAVPIGAVVDRVDRRKALFLGNIARAAIGLVVSYIVYQDSMTIEILLLATFLWGVCEVLVDTTSQAILPEILKSDQLERGNSRLNTAEVIVAQFVGTPLGGLLYAAAIALPFFLSGVGFAIAALIVSIFPFHTSLKPKERASDAPSPHFFNEIKFGIRYMYEEKRIFHLVVITTLLGFFFSLSNAIAPLFIIEELGVEPRYLGVLLAIQGLGALAGSVLAPRISQKMGRGRALAFNLLIASLPIFIIGFVPNVWYFLPLGVIIGATISVWNILLMSVYQSIIPRELYGRIHGARRTVVWGLMPIGSVLGGFVARGGLRLPYIIGGSISLIVVALSFKRIVQIGQESVAITKESVN
ncbi:MAG: MFS transporter [Candidatus Nanopelagicaceae bacterium]